MHHPFDPKEHQKEKREAAAAFLFSQAEKKT
jgi:hypothetical protein